MANLITSSGKEGFATAAINWPSDDIRIVLLSAVYVYDSAHDFLDDVPAGARVAVTGSLSGKTATGGILDATDIPISSVTGARVTQFYYYKHTGTESTSRLIVYGDQAVGLPRTPDGSGVLFEHGNGANKIAAL